MSSHVALCALALAGCAVQQPPHARRPTVVATADPGTRQQIYDQYKLTDEHSVWTGVKWDRADGTYTFAALDDVLASYPSTRELGHRARVRNGVTNGIAAAGGALVGFTLGYNEAEHRMSTDAQIATYGAGAGLVLTSLVLHLLWPDPLDRVSDTYNAALSHDLGLPPSRFTVAPTVVTDGSRSAGGLTAIGHF
jgi:hypothetical protein